MKNLTRKERCGEPRKDKFVEVGAIQLHSFKAHILPPAGLLRLHSILKPPAMSLPVKTSTPALMLFIPELNQSINHSACHPDIHDC